MKITILSTLNRIPTRGQLQKCCHIYFLLIVAIVVLLWRQIVLFWHQVSMVATEQHLFQTIVKFDKTIVLPRKLATWKNTWLPFLLMPLVGIPFEVLRIARQNTTFTRMCRDNTIWSSCCVRCIWLNKLWFSWLFVLLL